MIGGGEGRNCGRRFSDWRGKTPPYHEVIMDKVEIPYFAHEGMMARMERTIKRLWIALIVVAVLMFATNALWLYAWMQYDYVSETTTDTITVDGKRGVANYIGGDGDITNGENSKENSNAAKIKDAKKWQK